MSHTHYNNSQWSLERTKLYLQLQDGGVWSPWLRGICFSCWSKEVKIRGTKINQLWLSGWYLESYCGHYNLTLPVYTLSAMQNQYSHYLKLESPVWFNFVCLVIGNSLPLRVSVLLLNYPKSLPLGSGNSCSHTLISSVMGRKNIFYPPLHTTPKLFLLKGSAGDTDSITVSSSWLSRAQVSCQLFSWRPKNIIISME